MRELVGSCKECGKDIYCLDGFLNGIVLEDKSIVCFDCSEPEQAGKGQNATEPLK
ncbi:hypothetical protein [Paenibacillus harenae]|uniref:hypothetical protein n=1 Tax=Paenibacillus harenae TaxID=306543 RepID=UPI0004165310|nr:hypothetical protein [Paenibacillus harenae]